MGMIKEFKDFVMRGNVVDLAVGVIIGAAFGKIVSSAIEDLIMPVIGKLVGNVDFSNLYIPLSDKITANLSLAEAKKLGPVFAWGSFASILINFMILAFVIYLMVKAINSAKKSTPPPAPSGPTASEKLLMEIRDSLARR